MWRKGCLSKKAGQGLQMLCDEKTLKGHESKLVGIPFFGDEVFFSFFVGHF